MQAQRLGLGPGQIAVQGQQLEPGELAAAALLGDPAVLVLDEPANGLDPQGIRWLRDLLRSLAAQGRAVLVSSHLLAEVAQTADDVVIIQHGRTVTQAPLPDLLATRPGASLEDIYLELTSPPEGGPS